MYHLAKMIKRHSGLEVKIVSTNTKYLNLLNKLRLGFLYKWYNYILSFLLKRIVHQDDLVFLMEYFLPNIDQSIIAKGIYGRCRVFGLAHLVPELLNKHYSTDDLLRQSFYLDKLIVLGNSLRSYFISKGVPAVKVLTTFHYVDCSFYKPIKKDSTEAVRNNQIICMGNMARNFNDLEQIVKSLSHINFIICKGKQELDSQFKDLPNVRIVGFIEEDELKTLMQTSIISLNVMEDTIGSNVITTSLACGLVVVATNVGSITDYITDKENGFLYNSVDEAISIIDDLYNNMDKLVLIGDNAVERARQLDYTRFIDWLKLQCFTKNATN